MNLIRSLTRFLRDRRGLAAIEFALCAPIMILAYFGMAEICSAMLCERKTAHVASAVGDLTAQAQTLTTANMSDIFSIGTIVMQPWASSGLSMQVTAIQENAAGTAASPLWTCNQSGCAAGTGTSTVPSGLIAPGESVIQSVATYTWNSPVNYLFKSGVPFSSTYYYRPRIVDPIPQPTS